MAQTATRSESADQAEVERQLRIQLAAGYRLADKYGMSELTLTHISLRVPGPTPSYLINPNGMLFNEIRASDLVRVDLAGNILNETDSTVNRAGLAIHGTVIEARPDINCVVHTHSPYATAVSSLECGLLPMSQASLRFYGQLAYHDYGRAATDPSECSALAEDLGNRWCMLMRNHGILAAGKTVGQAFVAAFYLERACQFQVLAQSTGQPLVLIPEELHSTSTGPSDREEISWPALLRQLDREDPSYRE
jgi:ribulose-5-phosphate 4-epimerase/fuculose-1-phosphate aldolase